MNTNVKPGASEFKRFVTHVNEHHTLPDMPMNGNLGIFHEVATHLAEALTDHGYTGFEKALAAAQKTDKDVNIALSTADEKTGESDPRLIMGKSGKMFRTLSMKDVEALPDIQYLVAKILQIATVSLLFGESGTGKTFIALALAFAIAYGQEWLGRKVTKGKVLYIYAEGKLGLKPRLKALLTHHAVVPSPNIQFIAVPLHLIQDRQFLFNTIAEQGPDCVLVVVDTFSNCAAGVDQRDQEEVYPVLAVAHEITQTYGAHVLVVHHTNRQGTYSGSAAFRRHVDTMIEAEKEEVGQVITLHSRKQRDTEDFPDIKIRLQQVTIGTDSDSLESLTSCVVVGSQEQTEIVTPRVQLQMLGILQVSGQLTSNAWQKDCEKAHKISYSTFHNHLKHLLGDGLVETVGEKPSRGKRIYYTLSRNGEELVSSN